MLFTAPDVEQYISGVVYMQLVCVTACTCCFQQLALTLPSWPWQIMFEETLFQKGADGKVFAETLKSKGIIPGIKVYPGPFTLEQSALMPDSPPTSAAAC